VTRRVTLDPEAAAELEAAAVWYDDRTVRQLVEQVADRPAVGLGQLAVDPEARRRGIGRGRSTPPDDVARQPGRPAWSSPPGRSTTTGRVLPPLRLQDLNLRLRTDTGAPDTPPPSP
jgi:GNAT superfamily N-acetyltransferase